ncbi:MAG: putative inner membrane transporter YhbE [Syntrophorhabdus sp. PtaU1.Bin058]|nr:MAG: putative inner membrane transporter YhbE [Syntrophorhabdus sp. PtaU1.Bin058]
MRSVYVKLTFSAIFWGVSAIAGKILLETITPSQVTFLRFFIATLILCTMLFIQNKEQFKVSFYEHIKLAILGIVGIALCYYFYFQGLNLSTAFNAGLIESTIPLVTLALSVLIKEEKFDITNAVGFIVAYIGVVIIVTKCDLSIILKSSYNSGDIMLIFGTLCFGLYNVLLKKFSFSFSSQNLKLFYIFMYGSIVLLPWLLFDNKANNLHWSFSIIDILCLSILSIGASVLSYVFFNEGIKKIGASKASSFINLVPIITVTLALLILKEEPNFSQIIGSVVILTGVYICQSGVPFLLTKRSI